MKPHLVDINSTPAPADIVSAKSHNFGFSLAILANLLWGASFLASKYTLQTWGPFTASSLRFAIATITLFITFRILKRPIEIPKSKDQWAGITLIATSAFGVLYPLQLAGLKYISSSFSAAIMLTSPLIVLFLGKILLQENLTSKKWLALGIGMIGGIVLLTSRNSGFDIELTSDFLYGAFLTFASSGFLALSVILTRKYSKNLTSSSLTFWSMLIGLVQLTIAAALFEKNAFIGITHETNILSWVAVFFLGIVCSAFCFFIWNYSLTQSSPQEIASSMHIKTPTAVIIGVLIANEKVNFGITIGIILVMFGVWLSQQKPKKEI